MSFSLAFFKKKDARFARILENLEICSRLESLNFRLKVTKIRDEIYEMRKIKFLQSAKHTYVQAYEAIFNAATLNNHNLLKLNDY